LIAGYSMAEERAVHDRVLGRSNQHGVRAGTEAQPQLEEFLF